VSACLSDDEVLAFLDRGSSGGPRTDADQHLKQCADCRSLVAEAARGRYELDGDAHTLMDTRPVGPRSQSTRPARPLEPGALVARYRIVRPIGAGGAGVVYEAFDPQLGRRIALKMVRPDAADEISTGPTRLLREAQAMARLSHPNVVNVHDAGTFEGQVFAAMEYVDGRTLATWLTETRPAWPSIVRVFIDAGRGLAAAHSAHLIHRDFKPENVLLGSDGRARVTDFGLARTNQFGEPEWASATPSGGGAARLPSLLTLTEAGALAGTPAYMAPEQFQGARADERTDQFNFCAALYKALYRQRPFGDERGDTVTLAALAREVIAGHVREPPADRASPRPSSRSCAGDWAAIRAAATRA
jgi:serine/threonine protein kinase